MIFKKKKIDTNLFVGDTNKHITKYNLPKNFQICKNCLATNGLLDPTLGAIKSAVFTKKT